MNRPGAGNPAAGIGNRPGGGNVNRPGGNGNRPGGLVPRASTRPAQPSRPDLGVRPNPLPGVNRPGISPPGGGNVNRPGGGNGNRPGGGAGGGNGNRPGINPQGGGNVNRPGGGAGGGNGNRPGINSQGGGNANRPGGGAGGGNGNRPGINPPGGGNVNRPGGGAGGGNANRPGGGGLVPPTGGGNGNRPGGNNNVGGWLGGSNRPGGGVGGGNINRPGGNTNINRPGGNTNINRPTNITSVVNRTVNRTNVTNITNNRNNTFVNNNRYGGWGGGYGGGGRGNNWGGAGYIPAYNNYHNDWHNGYWNGRYSNNNWNWGSFATGVALGGVTTWGFGSSLYGWGYSSYANPYYIQQPIIVQQPFVVEQPFVVQQQVAFDYAQPIRTDIPPPDQQAAEPAIQTFDRGRSSFTAGDYSGAIVLADEALAKLPNDPTIHEFRALCLFALGRFDDSAATLYPVLAVGPGWDWSTMIGLYGTPDAYTNQLRGLEAFAQNNPGAASARFLLAYHYMTAGHTEAAEAQLARAVELKPTDRLSRQLLTAIRDADKAQVQAEQAAAAPIRVGQPPADPMPEIPPVRLSAPPMPRGATLTGNWIAKPSPEVSITLVIDAEGKFTWDVVQPGGKTKIAGTSNEEDGQLTLSGEGQAEAPLAGLMTWADRDHFTFKVIGSGADDPGLTFAKTP